MLCRPFFWIIALVVGAFVVSPLIGNDVQLRESLALAAVYITLASNLNLMLGYAGYINFGSIVFFGLGGYICIWLVDSNHWPLAASLIATGIGVSALSLIFGFGILRLRGPFFALSTMGIVEGVQAFVENFKPWGGSSGIYISPEVFAPLGGPGPALWVIYFLLVAVMAASLYLSYGIKVSKFGLGCLPSARTKTPPRSSACRRRATKLCATAPPPSCPRSPAGFIFSRAPSSSRPTPSI
jgi:branched-chain amino acid transport system permease protein